MFKELKLYKNVLSPKICQKLIDTFNNDPSVSKDPQPDYSTRDFAKISDSKNKKWLRLVDQVYEKLEFVTQDYFDRPEGFEGVMLPEWSDDGLVMSRYNRGDSLILHVDGHSCTPPNNHLRVATVVFYLNDVEVGGETFFPLQNKKIKPMRGSCIIFPPTLNFPHQVFASKSARYIIQSWIVDPHLLVVPNED